METLEILQWPHEALSATCTPVTEFGSELLATGQKMLDIVNAKDAKGNRRGIGLAAPQVGILRRFFVMSRNVPRDTFPDIIAVNPIVTPYGRRVPHQEGCLSTPDCFEQVIRPNRAHLRYQEPLNGEWIEVELEGYDAFCAQHEENHLSGIMFFDPRIMDKNLSKKLLKDYFRRMK